MSRPQNPRRRSLADDAERALRDWVAPMRHRSGDRLPPEHELAAMLGVSRGTLRTALKRLEETGDVVRHQGSGTFVGRVARPGGFREGLERLEPYSSLAHRRGVKLRASDVQIEPVELDSAMAQQLGAAPGAAATRVERVVLADGKPFALMVDTVHPGVRLPPRARLRRSIEQGRMVLDVLLAAGVPIAYSTTSVASRVLRPAQAEARALGVRRTTAVLVLDEVCHTTAGDVTHHSRDLFAPEALDLRVLRWLEAERPAQLQG